MSNTWVIYPLAGDNVPKGGLIPHKTQSGSRLVRERLGLCMKLAPEDEPASHQLVGEVMAHQGKDG